MKTTRFFAAAIALLSVLSCQKEEQQTISNSENEGGTIITCTFANNDAATRTTTTDGKTPLWAAGDEIMLYDGVSSTQKLTLAASGTASSTEGIIDGTDGTKFIFVKPSGWENIYAIYPYSACVSGFSASDPKINFAGQDGTFAKANICAAADIFGTMSFKNVGAILKFPSKPTNVTYILIPMASLAKDYAVSFSDATPSLASVDATNSNAFSIGSGTETIYIGVPAENLAAGMNFIYQDSNKDILGSYTTAAANDIKANKVYTLSAIAANGTIPAGMLSKAFSVSATKKVYFSNGNLYYDNPAEGTKSFKFEANQTTSNTRYVSTHVSHFRWAAKSSDLSADITSAISTGTSLNGTTSDVFFTNATQTTPRTDFTAQGATGVWRTLSSAEWTYLLNTRTDANRFAKAKVNSVPGLIIFPDGYTGTTSGDGIAAVNRTNAGFPSSSIPSATWTSMESDGCVFLPAAGTRYGSSVGNVSYGYYWSATPSNSPYYTNFAYVLYFDDSNVYQAGSNGRPAGDSVRLVCAAQ